MGNTQAHSVTCTCTHPRHTHAHTLANTLRQGERERNAQKYIHTLTHICVHAEKHIKPSNRHLSHTYLYTSTLTYTNRITCTPQHTFCPLNHNGRLRVTAPALLNNSAPQKPTHPLRDLKNMKPTSTKCHPELASFTHS